MSRMLEALKQLEDRGVIAPPSDAPQSAESSTGRQPEQPEGASGAPYADALPSGELRWSDESPWSGEVRSPDSAVPADEIVWIEIETPDSLETAAAAVESLLPLELSPSEAIEPATGEHLATIWPAVELGRADGPQHAIEHGTIEFQGGEYQGGQWRTGKQDAGEEDIAADDAAQVFPLDWPPAGPMTEDDLIDSWHDRVPADQSTAWRTLSGNPEDDAITLAEGFGDSTVAEDGFGDSIVGEGAFGNDALRAYGNEAFPDSVWGDSASDESGSDDTASADEAFQTAAPAVGGDVRPVQGLRIAEHADEARSRDEERIALEPQVLDACRAARDAIWARAASGGANLVLLTSVGHRRAEFTWAAHLGALLAELGEEVLCIDDWGQVPRAKARSAPPSYTFADVVRGAVDARAVARPTDVSRLSALRRGKPQVVGRSLDPLAMRKALDRSFRWVLINSGPAQSALSRWLAPVCHQTIVCLSLDEARRRRALDAVAGLRAAGARVTGAIVVDPTA